MISTHYEELNDEDDTSNAISTVNLMMSIYSWWCTKRNVVISFTINDTTWGSNHEISTQM